MVLQETAAPLYMMKQKDKTYYLENWPEHYYEIGDINEREELLNEVLKEHPDSLNDQRRLEILHKRYGKAHLRNRPDHFMHALLMIREMKDTRLNTLNSTKKNREFHAYMDELYLTENDDVLKEEYHDLLKHYIQASHKSFSRPAFLGMGKRSDDKVWDTIEEDLEIILKEIPARFHEEESFMTLKSIADAQIAQKRRDDQF